MVLPEDMINQVNLIIQSSKRTQSLPGHIMLDGIAGGGKTSLADVIANELGFITQQKFEEEKERRGETLKENESPEKMIVHCGISTNYTELVIKLYKDYKPNHGIVPQRIFFIDEAHALPKAVFEMLLPVLENNTISLSKNGINQTFDLPPCTWIVATTNPEKINGPFKNRFRHHITFYPYEQQEIVEIAQRNLQKVNLTLDQRSIEMLASISRQTPRNLNKNSRNLLDYTTIINTTTLTYDMFKDFLKYVGIDNRGYSKQDRLVIKALGSGPNINAIPLRTLTAITAIDTETLTEIIEPYLVRVGIMEVTSRGRMLTQRGNELYKELF